jgi:uncharacterized protein YndB with AHSA1/START domain
VTWETAVARYDRIDESVIHARPEEVWTALEREFLGETHWWLPELGFRPRRGGADLAVGSETEVIPAAGRFRGGRSPFAFVARAVEVVPRERLAAAYVAGAFLGSGDWTLEPVEEGTRLRMRWRVRTHGLLPTVLGLVVDLGAAHSRAMRAGFRRLDDRLARRPPGLAA